MKHRDCWFPEGCAIPFFCAQNHCSFPEVWCVANDPWHACLWPGIQSYRLGAVLWWVFSNRETTLLSVQWNQEWVHVTEESRHARQGDDRVLCAQVWRHRAGPTHWLCSLLARQPCTNHLALLTLTFLYSKMHTIPVYMFMVAIIKSIIIRNLQNPCLGPQRCWVVRWYDLQVYRSFKGKRTIVNIQALVAFS